MRMLKTTPGSGLLNHQWGTPPTTPDNITMAWTDASFKHGKMGFGVCLMQPSDKKPTVWTVTSPNFGDDSTDSELRAVFFALCRAKEANTKHLLLQLDSSMAIWHAVTSTRYPICENIRQVLPEFESVQLQWIPRQRNELANALSRMALQLPVSQSPGLRQEYLNAHSASEFNP